MVNRKGIAAVAACATLVCAGLARSADLAPASSADSFTLTQPLYADDAAPAARRPLMALLDKAGLAKSLDDAGINIFGFIEASYTYPATNQRPDLITGRVFDVDDNEVTLNQIDLTIQRTVDAAKAAKSGQWDLGFTLETIYGNDARFIHGNGADFYGPGSPELTPLQQFDIVQAYLDIAVPVGNGLLVRAGKMVTHMGYETINPTSNPLYSHSFLFGYAIPFTHTGFMAFYNVNDNLTVMGGLSRGWNQELKDNNGDAIDFLGQISYKISDKTQFIFNTTIGPEAAHDPGDWWWVGDAIVTHKLSDQLSIAINGDYGYYVHGSTNGKAAQWYGLAGYAGYKLSDMFTINGRAEWYDDNDGFTLTGTPNVVYEATLGVAITPMPNNDIGKNLLIRPEVRYDYADHSFFNGGDQHGQFTAALDVIFTF